MDRLNYGEIMFKYRNYDFADEIKKDSIKTDEIQKNGFIKRKTVINESDYLKDRNGTYISFELSSYFDEQELIKDIAKEIKKLTKEEFKNHKPLVLCYGIGNEYYSSDALGPKTIKKIKPTYHLENNKKQGVCALIPGVMGSTGLESAKVALGVIKEYKIDLLIVIDSLITHDEKRIFNAIQVTDAGLSPGSGLNNKRKELSKEYLKIPVIALGVATAMPSLSVEENLIERMEQGEHKHISRKYLSKELKYYTPKDAEEEIEFFSSIIASAINCSF